MHSQTQTYPIKMYTHKLQIDMKLTTWTPVIPALLRLVICNWYILVVFVLKSEEQSKL